MKVITSPADDFLYERIILILEQVKLVRGGTELAYTLRNHKFIRDYCKEKAKDNSNPENITNFLHDI